MLLQRVDVVDDDGGRPATAVRRRAQDPRHRRRRRHLAHRVDALHRAGREEGHEHSKVARAQLRQRVDERHVPENGGGRVEAREKRALGAVFDRVHVGRVDGQVRKAVLERLPAAAAEPHRRRVGVHHAARERRGRRVVEEERRVGEGGDGQR